MIRGLKPLPVALGALSVAAIAWVWLRPLPSGALPPPPARHARPHHVVDKTAAAPDDEAAAEEPVAALHTGLPEEPSRRDLEAALAPAQARVLQCSKAGPVSGFVPVHLVIARSGALQSVALVELEVAAVAEHPAPKAGTPGAVDARVAECIKHALHGLGFPRFRGTNLPAIEWTYPFYFPPAG